MKQDKQESLFTEKGIQNILGFIFLLCVLLVLSGIGVLLYQVYFWLRYGGWLSLPLSVGFYHLGIPYPYTEWGGIQKIIEWLLDCPLSAMLFWTGVLGSGLMMYQIDKTR